MIDGDNRKLSFKTDEVIFGGGRLGITKTEVPLAYESLMGVYAEANQNKTAAQPRGVEASLRPTLDVPNEEVVSVSAEPQSAPVQDVPTRSRRIR